MYQKQRSVLITGANRGLGLQLAKTLAATKKYTLILTARSIASLDIPTQNIKEIDPNSQILKFTLDTSSTASIEAFAKDAINQKISIDVFVHNAGTMTGSGEDIINVNLNGITILAPLLLPLISEDGKIILVSSQLGKLNTQPAAIQELLQKPKTLDEILQIGRELVKSHKENNSFNGWQSEFHPFYCASKALLNAYGRYVLANLVKENQSVFCIHPGWIKTDMGGQEAPGTLEEGVVTNMHLIDKVPFGRNQELHGKYFNDIPQVDNY